jgi:hypothetical protein
MPMQTYDDFQNGSLMSNNTLQQLNSVVQYLIPQTGFQKLEFHFKLFKRGAENNFQPDSIIAAQKLQRKWR